MKKIVFAVPAFLSLATFAEGETVSSGMQVVNGVSTGLTDFMTSATPVIVTLVTAGVALWAGFALIPLLKRAWKLFTGR